jgi:acetylornithine deacetylase/succinyl-diaminopimelate desuccinylase-like protein
MDLQAEATDVLSRLIRFDTVNPPGNERACQEWLKGYLEDAGLECELLSAGDPERPNLVARLRGEAEGPVLGYLSHVDTVLADAADWRHDPWSGEVHDGAVWGRGAIDMKSQTAAEVVAAAHLARAGWRPPRGELKVISVVDEETGGRLGAQWLTEERPDVAYVDWLLNEGGGAVMPYGDRRLYGVCCAEKGTFRFRVRARGRAGHAAVPALADNALLKLLPALERLGTARAAYDVVDEPRALLHAIGEDARDPEGAIARMRAVEPRMAAMVEPMLGTTFAPTLISAGEKINVIPARAEFAVDCRLPPGLDGDLAMRRAHELLGSAADGLEVEVTEAIVGNRSPIATPLMDTIGAWVREADRAGEAVPVVLPAFTDCRWFRAAFPDCVAYGFFPQRDQVWYETWPLMHSADERIDVRDLGFATQFFADLPRRLLT